MHSSEKARRRCWGVLTASILLWLAAFPAGPTHAGRDDPFEDAKAMRFAAEMARRGSWREARFRWEKLLSKGSDDARLLNNLGVAYEVLGEPEKARDFYARARREDTRLESIASNARRFQRFWSSAQPTLDWDVNRAPTTTDGSAADSAAGETKSRKKKKRKTWEVTVTLPVPPRLQLRGDERMLVASFLHRESDLFDINREMVRFARREFTKSTDLSVLDINPPPAVPEQTLEDLIANAEFWRYLGREFDSDIIVSGVLRYESGDASTFKDVDVVSPNTGQKIRTTEFVEQEEFILVIDLLFMNGRSGELMFRDRVQRGVIFPGISNDPFTAFYSLGETIVTDLLAVVTMQRRKEIRWIYR